MRPSLAAASRCLATSSTPVVSRSSRCTSRGRSPPKRSAMPASMPSMWRLVPVPPCTASPNGLLRTRTCSSSKRIIVSMRSRSALESPSGGFERRRRLLLGLLHDLRHAHLRARLEPLVGLDAAAVDAHLAGAQQLLQVGVADVGKMQRGTSGRAACPPRCPSPRSSRPARSCGMALAFGHSQIESGGPRPQRRTARSERAAATPRLQAQYDGSLLLRPACWPRRRRR